MGEFHFKKGAEIEISSEDYGFRGSWFAGTVIRPPSNEDGTVEVEYKTLMMNERKDSKPLRETLNVVQLRPVPPREVGHRFKFSEEVDAYYNDGWWEGTITNVLPHGHFSVFFRSSRDQYDFHESLLRIHREWVSGNWVPPLEEEEVPTASEAKSRKGVVKESFRKGSLVEVCSDEDGFQGAWFAATVVKVIGKEKFLIEYQSLRTDDDKEFLREEVDRLHIRPQPPEINIDRRFTVLDEVDALYNDGWWVGVVNKVVRGSRYKVYFKGTGEELELKHPDLRMHQDWINGEWVVASQEIG